MTQNPREEKILELEGLLWRFGPSYGKYEAIFSMDGHTIKNVAVHENGITLRIGEFHEEMSPYCSPYMHEDLQTATVHVMRDIFMDSMRNSFENLNGKRKEGEYAFYIPDPALELRTAYRPDNEEGFPGTLEISVKEIQQQQSRKNDFSKAEVIEAYAGSFRKAMKRIPDTEEDTE